MPEPHLAMVGQQPMKHFQSLLAMITTSADHPLLPLLGPLATALAEWERGAHGDWSLWLKTIEQLPLVEPDTIDCATSVTLGSAQDLTSGDQKKLHNLLRKLCPWKKGPFHLFGIHIDCEWRSDWKWERLLPHIAPLNGRRVLDVGCGSGYHLWRMWGAGASEVIGIDPSALFFAQYLAIRRYLPAPQVHFMPLPLEALPASHGFDTVFAMGVLYHRRSPLDHLQQLFNQLRPGGQLVLETLIVDGDETTVLVPHDRYARMANVWFLPSVAALTLWLHRLGFVNVACADINTTTSGEQRVTEWAGGESLSDFLDPANPNRTVEGLPAPQRAIFIAHRPG